MKAPGQRLASAVRCEMISMDQIDGTSSPAGLHPRLGLALELATRHRDLQNSILAQLRDRSFSLLEVVFLGAAIVLGFGASDRGRLTTWMVVLLLAGVFYCLAAACLISLPTRWQTTDWEVPRSGQLKWCDSPDPSVDQCVDRLLKEAQDGIAKNNGVLAWKRHLFISMFAALAVLIVLAVVFWATLGVA